MASEHDVGIGATIYASDVPQKDKYVVACLLAVGIWNALEMFPIIYFTFTRFSGLYFWSMLAANIGVLIHASGFVLNNFQITGNQTLPTILTCSSWVAMVSAQSLVLYSRLHLVNLDDRVRRWVLIMIILNGSILHTGTAITTIGSNGSAAYLFLTPYAIMERIQVMVFFLQELVLSSLYLYKAQEFLTIYRRRGDDGFNDSQRQSKSMMVYLIISNLLVVALDITIVVLQFMGLYFIQVSYKPFVYSVKLKCEVGILNRLVDFVRSTTYRKRRPFSVQLPADMEREWETTLRNTFGVAMDGEDGDGGEKELGNMDMNVHIMAGSGLDAGGGTPLRAQGPCSGVGQGYQDRTSTRAARSLSTDAGSSTRVRKSVGSERMVGARGSRASSLVSRDIAAARLPIPSSSRPPSSSSSLVRQRQNELSRPQASYSRESLRHTRGLA